MKDSILGSTILLSKLESEIYITADRLQVPYRQRTVDIELDQKDIECTLIDQRTSYYGSIHHTIEKVIKEYLIVDSTYTNYIKAKLSIQAI